MTEREKERPLKYSSSISKGACKKNVCKSFDILTPSPFVYNIHANTIPLVIICPPLCRRHIMSTPLSLPPCHPCPRSSSPSSVRSPISNSIWGHFATSSLLLSFLRFIEPLCFLVVRLFKGDRKTGYGYEARQGKASKLVDFRFLPYMTCEYQNRDLALGCG